ncbi:MAG: extracellular solute-binding protein, partial [Pseudomonadota bacterium]
LYDAEGGYHSTKLITTGIAYNTQAENVPTSYADLAKPEFATLTIMPSPLYSGAALIHMSTLFQNGYDASYYEGLKAGGAVNSRGNGGSYQAVAGGEEGYAPIVEFLAIRGKADGAPVDYVFPEEGVSYVTEPVAIMAGADDMEAAQAFVDFLLSADGQALVTSQGYIPARNGVASPEGFPSRDELNLMTFDPAVALDTAEENKATFERIFGVE